MLSKLLAFFSFAGGLQQKTDVFQLQPNNLVLAENVRFIKSGVVSKRPGTIALPTQVTDGTNISSCVAINTFNQELLLFDGNSIFSYLEGTKAWANRGTAISIINSSAQVIHTIASQQNNPDGVYSNGINVYTWEDSRGGVRYSVKDDQTQAFAIYDQLIFDYPSGFNQTLLRAKTIVDGYGLVNIIYTDGGTTLLKNQVNPARPTILSPTVRVLTDGYDQSLVYDVANLQGNLIYAYSAMLDGYSTQSVALLLPHTKVNVFDFADGYADSISCVNVIVDSNENIWVSFATQNATLDVCNVYTSCFNSMGGIIMAPLLLDSFSNILDIETIAAVETNNLGSVYVVYEISQANELVASDPNNYFKVVSVQNNEKFSHLFSQLYLGLASKAWSYNGNQFINVASQSNLQSTYFTYCLNRQTPVGKINAQIGGGYRTNNTLAECSPSSVPGSYLCAFGQKGRFQTNNNTAFTLIGISAEIINFTHPNSFNAGTFNNNFLFVGGFLQSYDGVNVSEQNFHFFPEDAVAIPQGSGGNLSDGLYQYQITYEWTDNYNQTQYSAPSLAAQTSVTCVASDSVIITVPTARVTAKENLRTPVTINFYRTTAGEGVFYKVGSIVNDTTVDTLTFTDTSSDVSIAGNQPLYTQSQVANTSPPACSLITYFQNRVMLSGLEDPNTIWFSQNVFDFSQFNAIAPEFSNLLTIGVDAWHGDITALGWMDQNLLIFKDQTIYTMNGDGPTALGTGDEFPAPTSLLSTVGSTNQNSLVVTYNGVFFKSSKGIYQVDRGLNPTYIGAPVEDYNGLNVTSAELLANTDEVIFATEQGTVLVYNYFFNVWSTWEGLPSIDTCIWQDSLVLAQSNGQLLILDDTGSVWSDGYGTFNDGYGDPISLKIQTPWMASGGMQSYQSCIRCFLLGTFQGDHILNVEVNTNYNTVPTQKVAINANITGSTYFGGLPNWGSPPTWGGIYVPYQFQVNFDALTVRNEAIQLTFYDSPTSNYNQGYTLSALTFELATAPDGMRLPKGQKVG